MSRWRRVMGGFYVYEDGDYRYAEVERMVTGNMGHLGVWRMTVQHRLLEHASRGHTSSLKNAKAIVEREVARIQLTEEPTNE